MANVDVAKTAKKPTFDFDDKESLVEHAKSVSTNGRASRLLAWTSRSQRARHSWSRSSPNTRLAWSSR